MLEDRFGDWVFLTLGFNKNKKYRQELSSPENILIWDLSDC